SPLRNAFIPLDVTWRSSMPAPHSAISAHNSAIADQFTRQAAQFAASAVHHNQAALDLLVGSAKPQSEDVALDFDCGPDSVVCALGALRPGARRNRGHAGGGAQARGARRLAQCGLAPR